MRENDIVEEYNYHERPKYRGTSDFRLMESESDNNDIPSRNSSLSARDNLDFANRSFELLPLARPKFSDDMMDIEEPTTPRKRPIFSIPSPETPRVKVEVK